LTVTFGEVTTEDIGRIDETALAKLIHAAQLIIEYLLYSQDYYRSQIAALDCKVNEVNTKVMLMSIVVHGS
jgi:hypothetical protein